MNENSNKGFNKSVINWYPGHMAKTKRLVKEQLEYIDLVYEVIDARMPYSSKIKDIDTIIGNKPRILIMTKMDLCDTVETRKWWQYYEQKGYHVLGMDLEHNPNIKELLTVTKQMMQEANEKRIQKGMKIRKTRVLIIGIPNVGKSTLINRLAGKKATNVGNKPGVTKELSWIRINDEVELLDTPGVLWPKLEEQTVALNLASLSAIKEEILPLYDVCEYVLNTLYTYYPEKIKERYGLDCIDEDIIATFDKIGLRRGCLVRGGEIDYDKVISVIMNDIKNYFKEITLDRFDS